MSHKYVCVCVCRSHHVGLLPWLTLRTCLTAVAGLVEELILPTDRVLGSTAGHTAHLLARERQESQTGQGWRRRTLSLVWC